MKIVITDIFLNKMIPFYWNNATNLHSRNFTQYAVLSHNIEIVM